jgi:hypothetical protein
MFNEEDTNVPDFQSNMMKKKTVITSDQGQPENTKVKINFSCKSSCY